MRYLRHAVSSVLLVTALTAPAAATDDSAKLLVDDDKVQCPRAAFTSIQAAVTAASPGSTILVCPGVYPEQVRIDKPLTIIGIDVRNENAAIIVPAVALPIISFTGAALKPVVIVKKNTGRNLIDVNLSNLTIDGSGLAAADDCTARAVGVYYANASGEMDGLAVRNISNGPTHTGCQGGLGIFVQSGNGGRSRVEIENSTVHDYDKNGITANEVGTHVEVHGNTVTGLGDRTQAAQNGIQIGFGARGSVDGNAVINHAWVGCTETSCDFTASNILLFGASGVPVRSNALGKSQVNIAVQSDPDFAADRNDIAYNFIFENSLFDGVGVTGGNDNRIHDNIINDSDEAGVFVDGEDNRVFGNTINEAPCGVQVVDGPDPNIIGRNKYLNTEKNVCPPPPPKHTLTIGSVAAERGTSPVR